MVVKKKSSSFFRFLKVLCSGFGPSKPPYRMELWLSCPKTKTRWGEPPKSHVWHRACGSSRGQTASLQAADDRVMPPLYLGPISTHIRCDEGSTPLYLPGRTAVLSLGCTWNPWGSYKHSTATPCPPEADFTGQGVTPATGIFSFFFFSSSCDSGEQSRLKTTDLDFSMS